MPVTIPKQTLSASVAKQALDTQVKKLYKQANDHIDEVAQIKKIGQGDWIKKQQNGREIWTKKETKETWEKSQQNGVEIWTKQNNKHTHEVRFETAYDQTIYIFSDPTKADRSLVGTNGKSIIKIFGDNSYDHIKTEDFITRGKVFFDTARYLVTQPTLVGDVDAAKTKANPYYIRDEERRKKFIDELTTQENTLINNIRRESSLDTKEMRGESAKTYFESKLKIATNLLKQSYVDMAASLQTQVLSEKTSLKIIVKDIQRAEKSFIAHTGRPIFLKIGKIQSQKMFSIQDPLGNQTLPSTERRGNYKTKLSNHVRDGSGHFDDDVPHVDVTIDGHSSYPAIGEKNEAVRRYISYSAAEEKVAQLVSDMVNADPSISNNITIPFSTMIMISPILGKKTNELTLSLVGKSKLESEHAQLADTAYALNMLRTRSPITITVKDKNNLERTVNVTVDVSYMNVPVNKAGFNFPSTKLQNKINNRGFYEFSQNISSMAAPQEIPSGIPIRLKKLNEILDISQDPYILPSTQKALADKYSDLNFIMKTIHDIDKSDKPNQKEKSNLYLKYNSVRKDVHKLEAQLNGQFARITELKRQQYSRNSELFNAAKIAIRAELSDIHNKLKNNRLGGEEKNNLINSRDYLLTQDRFLKAQQLFYSKEYLTKDKAYQFNINFLLANEGAGRPIEAFCKSAEDRTGWLRTSLLGHIAYSQEYGFDPDLTDKDQKAKYDSLFAAPAHELSASIENTDANSGARGMQVSDQEIGHDFAKVDIDKGMAGLAKKVNKNLPEPSLKSSLTLPATEKKATLSFTVSDAPIISPDLSPPNQRVRTDKSLISPPAPHAPTLFSTPLNQKTFVTEINHIQKTLTTNYTVIPSGGHLFQAQARDNAYKSFHIEPDKLSTSLNLEEKETAINTFTAMLRSYHTVYGNHLPKITTTESAKALWKIALTNVYSHLVKENNFDKFFPPSPPADPAASASPRQVR
jgi:hypothetical protein